MALALDRREGTGIGLAVLGHVILFGLLTVGFLATPNPEKLQPTPIEISLTDEAGLVSEAPEINREAPAERLAETPALPEPVTPPPVERPEPEPVVRPDPTPPKAEPRPSPRKPEPQKAEPKKASAAPPKAQPQPTRREVRPTGRLSGIVDGLTDQPSKGKAKTPQASQIGAAVKSSLAAEVIRQLRPHWRSPTGADVELLRTTVEIRLNRDGSLASPPRVINQTGVNASNRAQADLHKERALNAARLAAPFNLPEEYYDAWKILRPNFDRNLSR
ncbi:cell envelope biogenesis protein TolA [Sphingomonas sp. MS122]|uniref:cell envelope biogenesis protein TolA n=1 Tax=Sphingomonas sp. MS122 TaxID=3412683 RepID=UPI003C2D239E